jgi:outer membrane protein
MKYQSIVRTAGMALLCVGVAAFAEMKIGYINSQKIFKDYQGTKEAQAKFEKEVAKWEQEASVMKKEIEDLRNQLEKQSLLLSTERKKDLEEQVKQKYLKYQEFLQTKLGQDGEVLKRNEELTAPIVEKINKIIDKISKDERYDFIFDEANGGLIWAKPGYDLTDRVVRMLNSEQQ